MGPNGVRVAVVAVSSNDRISDIYCSGMCSRLDASSLLYDSIESYARRMSMDTRCSSLLCLFASSSVWSSGHNAVMQSELNTNPVWRDDNRGLPLSSWNSLRAAMTLFASPFVKIFIGSSKSVMGRQSSRRGFPADFRSGVIRPRARCGGMMLKSCID